ncbi:MAG: glycosyl transferase family 4 [Devosia sp.]|uniref:MraY family glycosyltransferase n=1 Tax=Devosia sp. TaxID=1871048 RepID=UPI00261525E3|nr:glycosyltransferase family 4 protein [Devosia sp.]MDB5526923.1 glycosyl transferase family 4 [Devosia sp.]
MNLIVAGLTTIIAFGLAWAITRITEASAASSGLIKAPNERSSHTTPTPRGGGIAIAVAGVLAAIVMGIAGNLPMLTSLAVLCATIAALGFVDDLRDLPPAVRFPVQIVVVSLLVWLAWPVTPLALPFGLVLSGAILAVFLVLTGLWWVNLFNFMDGIDGIAASQAILILLLACLIWLLGDKSAPSAPLFWVMIATAAATAGFLVRNWPPANIFMGDVGSNFLALLIFGAVLLTVADGALRYSTWLSLVSIFFSDATVTLLRRIRHGERPWRAHRRHAYQQLSRLWGHKPVTTLYGGLTLVWAGSCAFGAQFQPTLEWAFVGLCYLPLLVAAVLTGAGAKLEWSGKKA